MDCRDKKLSEGNIIIYVGNRLLRRVKILKNENMSKSTEMGNKQYTDGCGEACTWITLEVQKGRPWSLPSRSSQPSREKSMQTTH